MNHFHFPSAKLSETVDFYEHFFRFKRARVIRKTHILSGENDFILAIDESGTAHTMPKEVHLGFRLKNEDEVKRLFQQMAHSGVPMAGPLLTPSNRATHFYCKDPSGNNIEVGWYEI